MEKSSSSDNDLIQNSEAISSDEIQTQHKPIKTIIIITIGALLLISIIVLIIVLATSGDDKPNIQNIDFDYSIMMDAGSSSTKVYTYSYPERKDNSLPEIEQKGYFKKSPGIKDNTNFSPYFSEIFADAIANINYFSNNTENLKGVPIFLKGTAGLRKLSPANQEKAIAGIQKVIKEESPFWFEDDWARIINGTEEAYYSWITNNYVTGVLKKNDVAKKVLQETEGSLDMGGSSAEIAFVPKGKDIKSNLNVNLGHLSYNLYANCIEKYGQDDAYAQLNDIVVTAADDNDTQIEHPCYIKDSPEETYSKDDTKKFMGTGDVKGCEDLISQLVTNLKNENIDFKNFKQPSGVKFIAINGYVYTANSIGVTLNEYVSPKELYNKGKIYCEKSYEQLDKELPADQKKYLNQYCFTSLYYYHLLVDVFKLNPDEKNVKFADKINGFTPSWSLGAMAYEIGLLPFK